MRGWAAVLVGLVAAVGPARAGGTSRVHRITPAVVRLNSTLIVRGEGFGLAGTSSPAALILSGRLVAADGSAREVRNLRLDGARVADREVRAPVSRAFVDAIGLQTVRFEGTVTIAGLKEPVQPVPWSATLFPPDVLTFTARQFGFADETTATPPAAALLGVYAVLALFLLLVVFALFAGVASWAERRIAGRMQNRIGPNRVGPQGILQWLADGVKCFLKEDFIPPNALRVLFRVGPYFAMVGVVLTLVTIPFGHALVVTDLSVGVYYVLAVTGFTVVGILIGGFASANKWSLLGGFRSAAQIVSYEIPSGLAVATVVVLAGSLSFQTIIERQGGWPWQWYLFHNPFTFVAFFFFLVSSLAEGNRTPFDLPEAESELVAGYNTEYSGLRFVFYFFAEWGNLYIMSALMTALFLGGWQVPGVSAEVQAASWAWTLAGWAVFTAKALFLVFVVIWLRWTLPRIRVDQLMSVCWKYLVPLGAVLFLGATAYGTLVHGVAEEAGRLAMFAVGAALAIVFVRRLVNVLKQGPFEVSVNPFL